MFSTVGLVAGFLFLEEASFAPFFVLIFLGYSSCAAPQSLAEKKPKSSLPYDSERRPLLPSKTHRPQYRSRYTQTRLPSPDAIELEKPVPSMRGILRAPAVRRVLVSYAFMALVTVSVNAVFVLWLYTPVHSGGIGFSVSVIFGLREVYHTLNLYLLQ